MAEVAKIQWQFSPLWVLWDFWVGMCEESEPVVSLWYDSWGGTVTKLASGLLFFLPFPYICGGLFITLHCSTLPCGGLYITLHYSTLLGTFFLTLLYICALYGGRWLSLCHTSFVASSLGGCADLIMTFSVCGNCCHAILFPWELLSHHSLSCGSLP